MLGIPTIENMQTEWVGLSVLYIDATWSLVHGRRILTEWASEFKGQENIDIFYWKEWIVAL